MERTLITAAIALMLWSCHGGNDTGSMQELSRIDSLLSAKQNEEAQQRIQSIQPKDFSDEENAYYSLLLTQSHYKNYIDDTTDAVINKAVEYYKQAKAFAFEPALIQEIKRGLFEAYTAMGDTESAGRYR